MSNQVEITKPTNLLKEDGSILEAGYCKRNLYIYNREAITARKSRIKEWDFYQVSDGNIMVQMNIANISLASFATVCVLDLKSGERHEDMALQLFTINKYPMPRNGDQPYKLTFSKKDFCMTIDVTESTRKLTLKSKRINIDIQATMQKDLQSITIATPFDKPKNNRFFLTQKLNCMPTKGIVQTPTINHIYNESNSYLVMDWGRGVWPHRNCWYWGNGSTRLDDGRLFGFEITWGFGNTDKATETMLIVDGKAHKIGEVYLQTDPEIDDKWMEEWHFKSVDNRFNMTMKPYFDNATGGIFILGMKTHQVHGLWSGTVVLDDGEIVNINNMHAFCEKVYNAW